MKRALLPALLVTGAGMILLVGAVPAAASTGVSTGTGAGGSGGPATVVAAAAPVAERAAEVECQVPDPVWELSSTSEGTVTLRQCGGAGAADSTADELPLTGPTGRVAVGVAATLLGAGAGLILAARRRVITFTA